MELDVMKMTFQSLSVSTFDILTYSIIGRVLRAPGCAENHRSRRIRL